MRLMDYRNTLSSPWSAN